MRVKAAFTTVALASHLAFAGVCHATQQAQANQKRPYTTYEECVKFQKDTIHFKNLRGLAEGALSMKIRQFCAPLEGSIPDSSSEGSNASG